MGETTPPLGFTRKLAALCRDRNKVAVAERACLHKTAIHDYLKHGSMPRADNALRIARALDVDLTWLIDDQQDWPPTYAPSSAPELSDRPRSSRSGVGSGACGTARAPKGSSSKGLHALSPSKPARKRGTSNAATDAPQQSKRDGSREQSAA